MARIEQENKDTKGRFIIYDSDEFAGELTYIWENEAKIIIDHVGVDDRFGGRGFGKQLVMKAVEFAREEEIKIVPVCPFVKALFERIETIRDVLF